ncbi:MAG: GTPase KRas precursor [Candidatus Heimdallarchaeota archaeon LC_3]|nr:MAG: GTPase KRas precursor [Candidatus Heimdallarchaeota archaeon LC_3]
MNDELIFKVLLLGDGYCGKTSMRYRYMGQDFTSNYLATLGADFAIKEEIRDNFIVRYQIWDIAGQTRFNTLRKSFYLGSQGALILFDLTNKESLSHVLDWAIEFWENNGKGKSMPLVVIGNKIDLRDQKADCISTDEGKKYIEEQLDKRVDYKVEYIETSALTGENIDKAFKTIADYYMKMYDL